MGDGDDCVWDGRDEVLDEEDGGEIEVVDGFVEEEDVGGLEEG